jgi:GT2 family glycosyltransferase
VPAPDWIERGVDAMRRHPEAAIVAGRVQVTFAAPSALSLVEQFEALLAFDQRGWVERKGYGATANLFVRAEALRAVGGFDGTLRSRGDEELCRRVRATGRAVVYCDDAVVEHPARRRLADLFRRTRRLAGGAAALEQRGRARGARPLVKALGILRELVPPLRFAARVAATPEARGLRRKAGLVGLLLLVRWVGAGERLRLALGGEPLR